MSLQEWLLEQGIDQRTWSTMPPAERQHYMEAFQSVNARFRDQNPSFDQERNRMREMDREQNPDDFAAEPGGGFRRKRAHELQRDAQGLQQDQMRNAQMLMGMFGPKFRGGWGGR